MRWLRALGLVVMVGCNGTRAAGDATPDVAVRGQSARYLALGDSFTIGTGSTPEQAFPARMVARWGAAGCAVTLRNVAVNGYTTQRIIDRELGALDEVAPTFVTVAAGANDIVQGVPMETYRANLRAIFAALAAHGVTGARVVTLPQPDWSLSPAAEGFGERTEIARQIETYNDALREESQRVGARYVDLFPLMRQQAQQGLIAPDGLHPAAAAHDAWAAALVTALASPCSGT